MFNENAGLESAIKKYNSSSKNNSEFQVLLDFMADNMPFRKTSNGNRLTSSEALYGLKQLILNLDTSKITKEQKGQIIDFIGAHAQNAKGVYKEELNQLKIVLIQKIDEPSEDSVNKYKEKTKNILKNTIYRYNQNKNAIQLLNLTNAILLYKPEPQLLNKLITESKIDLSKITNKQRKLLDKMFSSEMKRDVNLDKKINEIWKVLDRKINEDKFLQQADKIMKSHKSEAYIGLMIKELRQMQHEGKVPNIAEATMKIYSELGNNTAEKEKCLKQIYLVCPKEIRKEIHNRLPDAKPGEKIRGTSVSPLYKIKSQIQNTFSSTKDNVSVSNPKPPSRNNTL